MRKTLLSGELIKRVFCGGKFIFGFPLLVTACLNMLFFALITEPAYAAATQSYISITTDTNSLDVSLLPSPGGVFKKSANSTITIATNNFTGYNLTIAAENSTSLVNSTDDEIASIGTAIDENTFSSSSTYNNKWGYRPNQYIATSGGVDTIVANTNFLPAPSVSGDLLAAETTSSVSGDTYTLSFGVRVDMGLPAGSYSGTYVLAAVSNPAVYNITYNSNTTDAVSNMPSPNPQIAYIDGGTSAADSYTTLSDNIPIKNDKKFAGWCDEATTTDSTTGDQICAGTTYPAGGQYGIDQTADGTNITLYAIWVDTLFPVVWNQMGACEFHGATNGNITGSQCTDYHNAKYIDTEIALYSQANYLKDYEVHFKIDAYNPNDQYNYDATDNDQQTFFSDKLASSAGDKKAPGIIVRRFSDTSIEANSKINDNQLNHSIHYNQVTDISIYRLNNVIYYSFNDGPLMELQNITGFHQQFDLTAWFGGYPGNACTGDGLITCTVKRIPEATLSEMYIKLGKYSDDDIYTITFDANGGTPGTSTSLIAAGNSVTTLPSAPTYTDHLFQGWFTGQSDGTPVSASTTPGGSTTYWAHWLSTVALADITNTQIELNPSETETINVTNSAELEPYTFSSNNVGVATVDPDTGEVTAVASGVATITMTGTTSGATKTITVTVSGQTYTVSFDAQGGTSVADYPVGHGATIDPLPISYKPDHQLEGWYTGVGGTGTKLTTSTVFDANTPTHYYANWEAIPYVCKVATTRHFETCTQASGYGCRKAGWAADARIDYGYLIQDSSTVTAGAAYDCDVDYDGTYDDETERFYYFGTENGNAKLIHYINMQNNASVAYDVAASYLPNYELDAQNPTIPVWDNPNLVTYNSGTFAGKAARFMTYEELYDLWTGGSGKIKPSDYTSVFLFENTNFATTGRTDGVWLQLSANNGKNRIQTSSLTLTHNGNTSANASRATIEVPTQYMEPYTAPVANYTITFNPHNETATWTETINAGDSLGNAYPATDPTYANHLFQGWYTAASGGTLVTSSTQPSGDTTYHAQWKGTVALATVASNSISMTTNDTATVTVTNAADLEGFTFSSSDTSVATIDSSTGAITPVAAGTTNISITGTSSNTSNQIVTVTVTQAVAQYTVYFNPHNGDANTSATVVAGSIIGSNNIPADPTPTAVDEVFMGWFTAASGGTAVDGNTTPSADGETYHAQYKKIVCKLAAAGTLHSSNTKVSPNSGKVEYGQIANDPTPQSGDAYDCDVDYDDTYSAVNERFYYLGQDANNNAVLVAWNSYYDDAWAPGTSSDSLYSYTDALTELPDNTSGAWDNPGLIEQEIGKAARFTTRAEVATACDTTVSGLGTTDILVNCDYLMEHAKYDGGGRSALWLVKENNNQYRIHTDSGNRKVSTSTGTSMVRPTIVVPDKLIEKYTAPVLDVTNAVIANNDLTVPVGGNITIQVSNSAVLEPYTFSSQDSTIATVDSSTGVVTGVSAGTVNIIMTGTTSGLTKTLEVDVLSSLPDHTVTFNTNGGTLDDGASSTRTVTDGDEVGGLPTASKTNHKFFGWYKDDGTFYEEVYEDEVIEDDITFYAKWVEDTSSLPIVWSEISACEFNGNAVISGDHCTQNKTKKMVDTGIALFNTTNYQNDFEIGFTIVDYDTSSQAQSQATLVNSKYENSGVNYPGFVLRRTADNFQLTSKWSSGTPTDATTPAMSLKTVKIVRQNGVLKYSFNGGALTTYYDTSSNTHRFDTRVWFGAAATSDNETPQRYLVGTLTDMYIRMGAHTSYNVELDPNGGTLPSGVQANYTITAGAPVGALPTPDAPNSNYTFGGWYDGNTLVSDGTQYVPTGDVTLVADWVYNSSDTPVVFDVSNDATRGFNTIINQWVGSPVNITAFNKNATINNSTWGDTNELTEVQFWTTLKNNFESNQCLKPSYGDAATTTPNPTAWANGSVDCAKPDVYDTLVGEPLNVYLYNNQTLGAQVAYAEADDGIIRNLIPGNTYKWVKDGDSTVYGYVTVTSNGSDHGTRWVDAGQIRNVRDLGGLPADTDGDGTVDAYVDYGRLFRGEKLWTAPATNLTNLGITKEYDVGDPAEYSGNTRLSNYQNDQVIHYNFDYNSGDENNATSNYMKAWTAVTDIMTDIANSNDPQNIYFHCRVGADRTGTVAYLLEGLLGVPDEARYQEYSLTHLSGLFDRTRYYKQKSSSNNLKFVFMMGYVQTTQDILTWYYHNPNADSNLVAAFRTAMTTPIASPSPSLAPGQQSNNSLQQNQLMSNDGRGAGDGDATEGETSGNGDRSSGDGPVSYAASSNDNGGSNEGSGDRANDGASGNSESGYSDPLGVQDSSEGTNTSDTYTGTSPLDSIATAAAVVAVASAASYAVIKRQESSGE